ncbi:hypothetical protein [Adhaeribacter pallidiroseus]|uniref:Uncharacterized protein n=1 Tax=Adhaeribacter pallidiroseus TaxID=2072847 RepID=A0A369QNZ9_9BACT|nr:hypothetical protein [Adhaeribacter pallidiroseus]RDC66454.1 hypothetical protein AHMF7616_05085 [Adhaeribacter pallidiroseus]
MVVDYLYQLQGMDVNTLKWQERESFITVLNYLSQRERDPHLLSQIKNQMLRLLPKNTLSAQKK